MKKFIISESEKKHILELYSIKEVESENSTETKDKWVSVNKKVEQRVTILDPTKYNNKIVFENLGFMLTILGVEGDTIYAGAKAAEGYTEDKERDGGRLRKYLGVENFHFLAIVKIKIDLSSSQEYKYTKLLNKKSLYDSVNKMVSLRADEPFAKNIILKNVTEKSTSRIQFRNFPSKKNPLGKENPLNASFPAGSVTITDWYYSVASEIGQSPFLSLLPAQIKVEPKDFELSDEDKNALQQAQKNINKQYKEYRKSLEGQNELNFIQLKDTEKLEDALKALKGKIIKPDKLFVVDDAKIERKGVVTLDCSKQTTNLDLDEPSFDGGSLTMEFDCKTNYLFDKNDYKYYNTKYGDTVKTVDKNFVDDLSDYVCKYIE